MAAESKSGNSFLQVALDHKVETIRRRTKRGGYVDYDIYESKVPSNLAQNMALAQQKKEREKVVREQDRAQAQSVSEANAQWAERVWQEYQTQKTLRRQELRDFQVLHEKYVQVARAREERQKQKEREDMGRQAQHSQAEARLKREQEQQQVRAFQQAQAQHAALWTEARKQQREAQKKQSSTSLGMPPEAQVPETVIAANRQRLAAYWKDQIELRAQEQREQQEERRRAEQEVALAYGAELSALSQREREVKQQRTRETLTAYALAMKAKEERVQQRKVERQKAAAARALQDQQVQWDCEEVCALAQQQRKAHVTAMQAHVKANVALKAEAKQRAWAEDRRRQTAGPPVEKKVLVRCPQTSLLLPPDCFNLVVTTATTSSL